MDEIFPVDENDTDVMITLDLDDGTSQDCEIIAIFEVPDLHRDYIALMPVDQDGNPINEEGEILDDGYIAYFYRYSEGEDGAPSIDNIETDEELTKVEGLFDELAESGAL